MLSFSVRLAFLLIISCLAYGSRPLYYQNSFSNGIHEMQLQYKNIQFKESYVKPSDDEVSGIVLRQLSNGRQVLNLIYNGVPEHYVPMQNSSNHGNLALKECKLEKGQTPVESFKSDFNQMRLSYIKGASDNTTSIISKNSLNNIPREFNSLLKFRQLKIQCFSLHRKLRKVIHKRRTYEREKNSLVAKSRNRRGLEEMFILPGTKWCGNKRLARSYQDLDGHSSTDSCCRDHDLCPLSIPLLTKKYGLYNRSFTTHSHCACDKRFKTCLKQTSTGASNIVGKVFFNIVKSQCFVFKRRKTCLKYGLWKCFKWGYRKQAVIKDNNPW